MRLATAVLIAGLCLPAVAWAEDDAVDEAAATTTTAVDTVAEAAQDITPTLWSSSDELVFTLKTYGWLAGVEGPAEASSSLPTPGVDSDSGSVFDNLDFFGFAVGEISRGNVGATVDVAYVSFTFDRDLNLPPPIAISGELGLEGSITTVEAFYRFRPAEDVSVDVLGGFKVFWIDLDLTIVGPGGGTLHGEFGDTWADAAIGGRVQWTPGNWTFTALGDVGAGSDTSDWGVFLLGEYRFGDHFGVFGGYRWLNFKYEKDNRDIDLTLSGPLIGASWTF